MRLGTLVLGLGTSSGRTSSVLSRIVIVVGMAAGVRPPTPVAA